MIDLFLRLFLASVQRLSVMKARPQPLARFDAAEPDQLFDFLLTASAVIEIFKIPPHRLTCLDEKPFNIGVVHDLNVAVPQGMSMFSKVAGFALSLILCFLYYVALIGPGAPDPRFQGVENRTHASLLVCGSATGDYMEPVLVIKGTYFPLEVYRNSCAASEGNDTQCHVDLVGLSCVRLMPAVTPSILPKASFTPPKRVVRRCFGFLDSSLFCS